jgi:glutathione synthase/RimK-type ligase-like ATP-grasp enzyme
MSKYLLALTDYKGRFGSKHFDSPYRSGMDQSKLKNYFQEHGIEIRFQKLHQINPADFTGGGQNIVYTSSEDFGYYYKSFIEDIILSLELIGCNMVPGYKYLRANNNKVFMELLRQLLLPSFAIDTKWFGSIKEIEGNLGGFKYPLVLKSASGASGKGVFLIKNESRLLEGIKKISEKTQLKVRVKDHLRSYKHKGYIKEPEFRTKFIVQSLIPNLSCDWKVYIFGERLYIFKRPIQKGRDIRASGGGYDNYYYGLDAKAPEGLFSFANEVYNTLQVPHISLDIAYDGNEFYLIEFQILYFGTAGIPYSEGYFIQKDQDWQYVEERLEIEKVYADSIRHFLSSK